MPLATQPAWMASIRPLLKAMAATLAQHSTFRNAARPGVIRGVLKQAHLSGDNIDDDLVNLPFQPTPEGRPKPFAASSTCSTTISHQS